MSRIDLTESLSEFRCLHQGAKAGTLGPPDLATYRAARDKLEENLKEITADAQPFEKVIDFLRNNMGGNIIVNWTALAALTPQIDRPKFPEDSPNGYRFAPR